MCKFLSGIVFKQDGRLLADPLIDSHTLLQKRNNIHTQYESRDYCLVEITGKNADLDSYHLDWTQERKPDWWRDEWDDALETRAKQIIAPLCVNGDLIREGVEDPYGNKYWYLNGFLHRTDGPAIECSNGYKVWYVNGQYLTEHEFSRQIKQGII